jgi:peptide deformylase
MCSSSCSHFPHLFPACVSPLSTAEPYAPEEICSEENKQFVRSLIVTAEAHDGVGIAAPQVGVSKQLFVAGFEESSEYTDIQPLPTTGLHIHVS